MLNLCPKLVPQDSTQPALDKIFHVQNNGEDRDSNALFYLSMISMQFCMPFNQCIQYLGLFVRYI